MLVWKQPEALGTPLGSCFTVDRKLKRTETQQTGSKPLSLLVRKKCAWPARPLALQWEGWAEWGAASLGHQKDTPPGATVSLCFAAAGGHKH